MQTHFATEEKLFALLHQHLFLMMLTSPGKGKHIRTWGDDGLQCCVRPAGDSSGMFEMQTHTHINTHTCMHRLSIQNPHKFYWLANEIFRFKFILILAQTELISCFFSGLIPPQLKTKKKKTILFLLLHFLLLPVEKNNSAIKKGLHFCHTCAQFQKCLPRREVLMGAAPARTAAAAAALTRLQLCFYPLSPQKKTISDSARWV